MDARKLNWQERFWNRMAKGYDKSSHKEEKALEDSISALAPYIGMDDKVLDFACGTGTLAIRLAIHAKEVHGIDLSAKMIETAKSKSLENGLINTSFQKGTLENSGYSDGAFDSTLAFNILHLLDDIVLAVEQINRLLKPKGIFVSSTPCLSEQKSMPKGMLQLLHKLGLVPKVHYYQTKELEAIIEACGFDLLKTIHITENSLIIARKHS